jgi:gas vesicle protein
MGTRRTIFVPETSLVALPKHKGSDLVCILYDGAIYVFDRSCFPYKARGCYKKHDAEEIATIWWSRSEEISYFVKEGRDVQTINLKSLDPEIPPDVAGILLSPKPRTDAAAKDQNGEDLTTNSSCGKSLQELKTENDQLHSRIEEATATLARLRPPHTDKIAQLYDGLSNQIKTWVLESFNDFEDDENRGFETMLSRSIARYPGVGAILRKFQLETLKGLESSLASELWQYKRYGLMATMMRYVCEVILSEPLPIVREEKTRLLEATFQSLTAVEPPKGNLPVPGTHLTTLTIP